MDDVDGKTQRKFYLWWGMRAATRQWRGNCLAAEPASRSDSWVASPHIRTSQRWNSTECMRRELSTLTARRPVGGCGRLLPRWDSIEMVCFRPVIHSSAVCAFSSLVPWLVGCQASSPGKKVPFDCRASRLICLPAGMVPLSGPHAWRGR